MSRRSFDTSHLLNLAKTIEFKVKSTNPEADACEVYDNLIMVAAVMGSDIAKHSENPEKSARIFGNSLTDNIINIMKMAKNE